MMCTKINYPCCKSIESNELYSKKEYPFILTVLSKDSTIRICQICDTAFVSPMPTNDELEQLYCNEFEYPEEFTPVDKKGLEKRMNQIEKFLAEKKGKLLDVGCASGFFLSIVYKRGWEVYRVDFSEKLLKEAYQRVKDAFLFLGKIENAGYKNNYFDMIMANNILEHLVDPVAFLHEINRILKPGGFFVFRTVRIDSLPAKKSRVN